MKLNTIQHPKLLRLRRRLSVPTWGAVGILESLWHLTAHHAKDGAIGKTFTNEDIANAIGWDGEPDQLIEALVSAGWLDVCEVNRLVVHDWHDHCPEFVRGNIRRMKKEFATGPNTVPNTVPYSVGNTVPYSVPYSVPNTVGNLSTVLQRWRLCALYCRELSFGQSNFNWETIPRTGFCALPNHGGPTLSIHFGNLGITHQ